MVLKEEMLFLLKKKREREKNSPQSLNLQKSALLYATDLMNAKICKSNDENTDQ